MQASQALLSDTHLLQMDSNLDAFNSGDEADAVARRAMRLAESASAGAPTLEAPTHSGLNEAEAAAQAAGEPALLLARPP
jgi:hypothetical protein